MFKLTKKRFNISRDPYKGLYLQFNFKIIDDTLNRVRYEIYDENHNPIYISGTDYLSSPLEINNLEYLSLINFKEAEKTTIYINIFNEDGDSEVFEERVNINNFFLGDIETKITNNELYSYFKWEADSYSIQDLYGRIELLFEDNTTKESSYKKILKGTNQNKISVISIQSYIDSIKESNDPTLRNIKYRLNIVDSGMNHLFYVPETGYLTYFASYENERPNLRLDNIELKRVGNVFQLKTDLIFHDSNLDDVKYCVEDNQGNILFQEDYFSYTPRIQQMYYTYDIKYFNSLFLDLNSSVTDNLTFTETRKTSIPLFTVDNLRINRDRLYWDVTNFSNSILKTNVQILDINNVIVYEGDVQLNRIELSRATVTDDTPIKLLEESDVYKYYKFRIKIRCDEENFTDYVEFDTGTLVSTQHHLTPVIDIKYGELLRDLDNNKKIHLIFSVNGKNGDLFKYSIYDDSGNTLLNTKDYISIPQDIDIFLPYDFVNKLSTDITIDVATEYNKKGTASITLDSYYIRNLKLRDDPIILNHIFQFECDNYCIYDLLVTAEVYQFEYEERIDENNHKYLYFDDNLLLPENGLLYNEYEFNLTNTIDTILQQIRMVPKPPVKKVKSYDENGFEKDYIYFLYGIRLRVDCPDLNVTAHKYIYPNNSSILLKSIPKYNELPSIEINYVNKEFINNYSKMKVDINVTFSDGDFDRMMYSISDKYGDLLNSEGYVDYGLNNSINLNVSKTYDLLNIDTSFLQLYFKNVDEDGSRAEEFYKIPLHTVNNISYLNGEFVWNYRMYSKASINMVLEILDDKGYLYAVSKPIKCNYSNNLNTIRETIDLKNFEEGIYRYRVRTYSVNEAWNMYYPNMNGNYMELEQPTKLEININSAEIDTGKISINRSITSTTSDGRNITYIIYDDVD